MAQQSGTASFPASVYEVQQHHLTLAAPSIAAMLCRDSKAKLDAAAIDENAKSVVAYEVFSDLMP